MPLSTDALSACENRLNQISTEIALAKPGTQDSLVPIYSILSELSEYGQQEAFLASACHRIEEQLSSILDQGAPMEQPLIDEISAFINWAEESLNLLAMGKECSEFTYLEASKDNEEASQQEDKKISPTQEDPRIEIDSSLDNLLEINPDQDRELLEEFHTEANDHLEQIEANLLALEKNSADNETLNGLFRSFHTIKGVAGFLKLTPIQRLAHEVESLMDHARKGKLQISSAMITLILQVQDAMRAFAQQIAEALSGTMPTEVIPVSHLVAQVQHLAQIGLGETLQQAEGAVEMSFQPKNETAPVPKETEPEAIKETKTDEKVISTNATPTPPAPSKTKEISKHIPATVEGTTIRVNTVKLDNLMDMVGELVIVQSQLQAQTQHLHNANQLQRSLGQLLRISKDLQHTTMSLRMVPIKPSFQKVSRMVRDLAKSSEKNAELFIFGEETELDRNVVEQIADPLVHMIRNAIDHGLETPEERAKTSKPEIGKIELKAYHMGSNIVIEMSDDGKGINPQKVLAKAQANGVVGESDELSEEDIINLIFSPGLSTAEKVTDISGRGVGMDVVKRNIEQMRGTVEVKSALGQGSTFTIKLPLTMAIIDGLIIAIGEDHFILPTNSVKIALKPTAKQFTTMQGKAELLHWRGKSIPLIRLGHHFGIESKVNDPVDGIVVILEIFGKSYGLMVDSLIGKQEVVIKNLGNLMQNRPGIAGGAILGDGSIALILDPVGLCHSALK